VSASSRADDGKAPVTDREELAEELPAPESRTHPDPPEEDEA
jgi:hypothetical protein